MDYPSFPAFPWLGALLCGLFCLTVAALAGSTMWVRQTTARLPIDAPGRWNLLFGGLCLVFLMGSISSGLVALVGAWLLLTPALIAFTRLRDAQVAESKAYLSGRGLANILADIGKTRPGGQGSRPPRRLSVREQLTEFLDRIKAAAAKGRKRPAQRRRTAAAPAAKRGGFAFLKKDGTTAIELPASGDCRGQGAAVSDSVCSARDVMLKAIRAEATDVHLEPHEQGYVVRARVDGVLRDIDRMSGEAGRGAIAAIKVFADMGSAGRSRTEEGAFAIQLEDEKHDIRVASAPTNHGEKMVMRLLRSSGGAMPGGLAAIGLRPPLLKEIREIIHKPYGMFLVVGPPDSGKATSAYAALSEIDAHQHTIATIEDPIKRHLDDVTQVAVNTEADESFAGVLRSVLRQNPDVLLVGEIRDRETAEIACQAALTGHFVFSTLHANDSVASITRLLDLGLNPTLIQTALTAVLGQRLARRLCPDCREACAPPEAMLKKLRLKPGAVRRIYREKGCAKCGGSGFRGRLGIHELLVLNNEIRGLIRPAPSITELKKAAIASGTVTLQLDGLLKVLQGETSVNEILRVTN